MYTLLFSDWAGQSTPVGDKMTVRMLSTWTREIVEILHMEMSREVSWRRVRRVGRQESSQANPGNQLHILC